jgi:hypothetical protein
VKARDGEKNAQRFLLHWYALHSWNGRVAVNWSHHHPNKQGQQSNQHPKLQRSYSEKN